MNGKGSDEQDIANLLVDQCIPIGWLNAWWSDPENSVTLEGRLLILQGGNYFVSKDSDFVEATYDCDSNGCSSLGWAHFSVADFSDAEHHFQKVLPAVITTGMGSSPDFSVAGAPMKFGFAISSESAYPSGELDFIKHFAVDQFSVTLYSEDTDSDGSLDFEDNCTTIANGPDAYATDVAAVSQCDKDSDGYGNACDGDLDQNGYVTAGDVPLYLAALALVIPPPPGDADFNCDGFVTPVDTSFFVGQLSAVFRGPSGYSCAGTAPCPP